MHYQLLFHSGIQDDIDDAFNWYEDQLVDLGERFLHELTTCYKKISESPLTYGKTGNHFRKITVAHFPYIVVYEVVRRHVYVYAVFHTGRNPKIIEERISAGSF